jgi:predicted phosphodiesterase
MKIVAIPDTHFPFVDHNKLNNALKEVRKFKPDVVVQLGDLYDLFAFSKYPRDHSSIRFTPEQECLEGRELALEMWKQLRAENRGARLIQIADANHDMRVVKRLEERFPEAAFIGKNWLQAQLTFPGVELLRSHFIVDGIMFEHGNKKPGDHARFNQMSTITGHTHKARIEYFANRNGPFWEMNCGYLGDSASAVFSYKGHNKIDLTHTGIGLVENGQPRFYAL